MDVVQIFLLIHQSIVVWHGVMRFADYSDDMIWFLDFFSFIKMLEGNETRNGHNASGTFSLIYTLCHHQMYLVIIQIRDQCNFQW